MVFNNDITAIALVLLCRLVLAAIAAQYVTMSVGLSVYNEFVKVKTMIIVCYTKVDQQNGVVYAILCMMQYHA